MMRRNGFLPTLILATTLTSGVVATWYVAANWSLPLISRAFPKVRYVREQVVVTTDGEVQLSCTVGSGSSRWYEDLDGNRVETESEPEWLFGATLIGPERRDRLPRIVAVSDQQPSANYWYFVHDGQDRHGYFEGYDSETKQPLGFIGVRGFSKSCPPTKDQFKIDPARTYSVGAEYSRISVRQTTSGGFPQRSSSPQRGHLPEWLVYLASSNTLYEIDLRQKRVSAEEFDSEILSVGKLDRLVDVAPDALQGRHLREQELIVRTAKQLTLYRPSEDKRRQFQLPSVAIAERKIDVFNTPHGNLLISGPDREVGKRFRTIMEIDPLGQIVWQRRILRHTEPPWAERFAAIQTLHTLPVPAYYAFWTLVVRPANHRVFDGLSPQMAFQKAWNGAWPCLAVMLVSGLISAAAILRRQRRYAADHTIKWMVFGFAFGVAGWVGYLAHRRWPAVAACPECGVASPRDRSCCAECDEEFALPPLSGTEVFA